MSDVTQLLAAARRGEGDAVDRLYSLLYDDLRRMARARLRPHQRGTLLDTTSLVHESYMRLVNAGQVDVSDRAHFMAYASRVMRSVIIDFVRSKQRQRRGGEHRFVTLNTNVVSSAAAEEDLINLSEALDELAKIDERMVRVVEMRYFGGLNEQEIATALGVTDRTVRRDWEKARLLLIAALK